MLLVLVFTLFQINKIKHILCAGSALNIIGWCGDEMEIRAGLEYLDHMGCIVGLVEGPIAEKDITTIDQVAIPKMLATKIMMIHLVTSDGKRTYPLGFFPTNGATAQWLKTLVC